MSRCPWTRPLSLFVSYIKDSCCFPLSVHASLCQPVVHDAEGADPSRESVLPRAGAGLARVPDGHLRKLLLHNRQVHLQDRIYIKRNNRWGNICSLRLKSYLLTSLAKQARVGVSTSDCTGVIRGEQMVFFPLVRSVDSSEQRRLNKCDWKKPDI